MKINELFLALFSPTLSRTPSIRFCGGKMPLTKLFTNCGFEIGTEHKKTDFRTTTAWRNRSQRFLDVPGPLHVQCVQSYSRKKQNHLLLRLLIVLFKFYDSFKV